MATLLADRGLPYLAEADDGPHVSDGRPGWREDVLVQLSAPEAGVTVWTHLGTPLGRADHRRTTLVVLLSDGRVLSATGQADHAVTPDSGALELAGFEPFRAWELRFDGDVDDGRAPRRRPAGTLTLRCRLTATAPAFDFGDDPRGDAGRGGHYAQHLRLEGTLSLLGREVALDGHGLREHAWGVRRPGRFRASTRVSAAFPSGRTVCSLSRNPADAAPRSVLVVDDGQGQRRVRSVQPPALPSGVPLREPAAYVVHFRPDDRGAPLAAFEGVLGDGTRLDATTKGEITVAPAAGDEVAERLRITATRFVWDDGETGHGVTIQATAAGPAPSH